MQFTAASPYVLEEDACGRIMAASFLFVHFFSSFLASASNQAFRYESYLTLLFYSSAIGMR